MAEEAKSTDFDQDFDLTFAFSCVIIAVSCAEV